MAKPDVNARLAGLEIIVSTFLTVLMEELDAQGQLDAFQARVEASAKAAGPMNALAIATFFKAMRAELKGKLPQK